MSYRESFNIKNRLKSVYSFKIKLNVLFYILISSLINKTNRKLFIIDNFIIPYNKSIRCKLKPHIFKKYENNYYLCKKCYLILNENEYYKYIRKQKIKKIKKKL